MLKTSPSNPPGEEDRPQSSASVRTQVSVITRIKEKMPPPSMCSTRGEKVASLRNRSADMDLLKVFRYLENQRKHTQKSFRMEAMNVRGRSEKLKIKIIHPQQIFNLLKPIPILPTVGPKPVAARIEETTGQIEEDASSDRLRKNSRDGVLPNVKRCWTSPARRPESPRTDTANPLEKSYSHIKGWLQNVKADSQSTFAETPPLRGDSTRSQVTINTPVNPSLLTVPQRVVRSRLGNASFVTCTSSEKRKVTFKQKEAQTAHDLYSIRSLRARGSQALTSQRKLLTRKPAKTEDQSDDEFSLMNRTESSSFPVHEGRTGDAGTRVVVVGNRRHTVSTRKHPTQQEIISAERMCMADAQQRIGTFLGSLKTRSVDLDYWDLMDIEKRLNL